jgi:hypothetical protein
VCTRAVLDAVEEKILASTGIQTLIPHLSSPQPVAVPIALYWLPPTCRWENNIKVDLQEIGWSDMDCIHLAHYRE